MSPRILYILIIALSLVTYSHAENASLKKDAFTVVIDPGHGGKDTGAVENGVKEKDINLAVSANLKMLLNRQMPEVNVVMTRDKDEFITLQQRAETANKAKGDIFISIHSNSLDRKNRKRTSIEGASVYALGLHKNDENMEIARRENSVIELENGFEQKYSGFDPTRDESYIIFEMAQKRNLAQSIKLAENIQKKLVASGRQDRGVHQAGFWVLWATSMPSVLVELDFVSNPRSAKYLSSEKGRKELAESICEAVIAYVKSSPATSASQRNLTSNQESDNGTHSESFDNEPGSKNRIKTSPKQHLQPKENRKSTVMQPNPGVRKRRSDKAKADSEARVVETTDIKLHAPDERIGIPAENIEDKPILSQVETAKESGNKKKSKRKNAVKGDISNTSRSNRKSDAHNAKTDKFVTVYKIQLLASSELLKQNDPRFQGLSPLTVKIEGNLNKYYYGETTDLKEIERLLKDIKRKVPDAFIVSEKKMSRTTNEIKS